MSRPVYAWGLNESVRLDLLRRGRSGTELPAGGPARGPGGRGAIWIGRLGGCDAVLKQHRHGGLTGRILERLRGATLYLSHRRLSREVDVASRLQSLGGQTARPLGWLAVRVGLFQRLYSATVHLEGTVSVDQRLGGSGGGHRRLLVALARALARAHHAGLAHPDLNLGNLLVRTSTPDALAVDDIFVIDLSGARLRRPPLRLGIRARNLARLERSALKLLGPEGVAGRDRWRFLMAYGREWATLEGGVPPDGGRRARRLARQLRWHRRLFWLHGVSGP